MSSRLLRSVSWPCIALLAAALGSGSAQAGPLYTIADLGTLAGQTSSVATAINNQGQVVGISYNTSDGYFTGVFPGSANPPRFTETGGGAQSFLYSAGQMSQISPTGGLAMSINESGQVVGGQYSSINSAGQYVGGQEAGIQITSPGTSSLLVSGATTTSLPSLFVPYSINDSGQVAGLLIVNAHGGSDGHPALYQNGQVTDLFSKVASGEYYDSRAIAINQSGAVLINVLPFSGSNGSQAGSISSYLYSTATGLATNLTALPGGSGIVAAALNDNGQVVGNGFLYSNGTIQTLASLVSSASGWTNLNATGINDSGQIVGQGTYNGQLQAFEMSPIAENVPEPGAIAVWALGGAAAALWAAAKHRLGRRPAPACLTARCPAAAG